MSKTRFSNGLKDAAKRSKDAKERERLRALYAISIGYSLRSVAEIFSVDEGTVYRWIYRWRKEKTLSDRPKLGRPGSLSKEEKQNIRKLISEGVPKKHGIEAEFWNTKELREYFSKKGRRVSQETLRRYLKEMGAKYVKAEGEQSGRKSGDEFAWQFVEDMKFMPYSLLNIFDESELPKRSSGWTFQKRQ